MSIRQYLPLLERVKEALGVCQDGPGTQAKPAQSNQASTSAAMSKLKQLRDKQTKNRPADTKIKAYGARKATKK